MTAVQILMWWIAPMVAIVYVVGYSTLFHPLRKASWLPPIIKAMLDCPMCIGGWAGMVVGFINWMPVTWPAWMQHVALGCCLSIAVQYIIEVFGRE
jgi:hypothetical protein